MNPNKYGIIDDIKLPKILAVCHIGTQTNNDSANSSTHSSKSKGTSPNNNSSEDVSVKIFEFSQIVQDADHPETITIVRDIFSEEILDHSNEKSQDATANRYKYCREVIKPFLKENTSKCQTSDEDIIKDVLESVQKDFPDYQPCFKNNDCSDKQDDLNKIKKNQKPDQTNTFLCDKVEAKAPSDSGSSIFPVALCPSKSGEKSDKNKGKSSNSVSSTSTSSMDKKNTDDDYNAPYDPCTKPKCERKAVCPEEIKPCKKPKSEPKTPPAPFCPDDSGPNCTRKLTTGCESAEDLKELDKQRKKACRASPGGSKVDLLPPISTPPGPKSVIEAHCEAFDTVKQAATFAFGKVFDATKETVTLIRTESAKHLEKIRASKSECEDSRPPSPKKDSCTREVSNILSKRNIIENLETLDAEDVLHKIVDTVDSTISMISEHIDFDTIANILKTDENSYDRPTTPPQKLKHKTSHHSDDEHPNIQDSIHDVIQENIQANINSANSVFTAIKSKIFSLFSEVTKGTEKEKPEEEQNENLDDDDES